MSLLNVSSIHLTLYLIPNKKKALNELKLASNLKGLNYKNKPKLTIIKIDWNEIF